MMMMKMLMFCRCQDGVMFSDVDDDDDDDADVLQVSGWCNVQ